MNDFIETELYKSRSYTGCISAAFNTTAHNLKTIVAHTLVYAIAAALTLSSYVSALTCMLTDGAGLANTVWLALSTVLSICATVAFTGRATTLVNGRKTWWNIKRASRPAVLSIAFWAVVAVILSAAALLIVPPQEAAKDTKAVLTVSLAVDAAYIIICLLTLPYIYVFAKYMLEADTKLRAMLFKPYKKGLRHWGFIFTTQFLAGLCMAVCAVILALPAVITLSAKAISISGMTTYGDPSGLPSYFGAMQFGVFAFAAFVGAYINVFYLLACYYMYGSIETREKEKKEFITKQQQTEQ